MKNNLTFVAAFALLFALGGSGAHGSTIKGGHGTKPFKGGVGGNPVFSGGGVRPELNFSKGGNAGNGFFAGGQESHGLALSGGTGVRGFAKGDGARGNIISKQDGNQGSRPQIVFLLTGGDSARPEDILFGTERGNSLSLSGGKGNGLIGNGSHALSNGGGIRTLFGGEGVKPYILFGHQKGNGLFSKDKSHGLTEDGVNAGNG
jgi:hypothetical protein